MNEGYIRTHPRAGDTYEGLHGVTTTVTEVIWDRVRFALSTGAKSELPIHSWHRAVRHARLIRTADGPVTDEWGDQE